MLYLWSKKTPQKEHVVQITWSSKIKDTGICLFCHFLYCHFCCAYLPEKRFRSGNPWADALQVLPHLCHVLRRVKSYQLDLVDPYNTLYPLTCKRICIYQCILFYFADNGSMGLME